MQPPSTLSWTLRNTTSKLQAYTPVTSREKLTILRFSHNVTLLSGLQGGRVGGRGREGGREGGRGRKAEEDNTK